MSEKLLCALLDREDKRHKRIRLSQLWSIFNATFPHLRGRTNAREELAHLLGELQEHEHLVLPRSKKSFETVAKPPLPLWIELPEPRATASLLEEAQRIAWHPELAFVRHLNRLTSPELESLKRLQHFLTTIDSKTPYLTVRERSLELFGDDKYLETLLGGRLVRRDSVLLELFHCLLVDVPFVYFDTGYGEDLLIVENKDTYHSACRAAVALGAKNRFRFFIFGSGHAVLRSIYNVRSLKPSFRRIEYFGDIDLRGLQIPFKLQHVIRRMELGKELSSATALYNELYRRAVHLSLDLDGQKATPQQASYLSTFLPPALQQVVIELLLHGGRWPQEAVAYPRLLECLS